MLNTTIKLNGQIDEMMETVKANITTEDLLNMSPENIKLIQNMIKLTKTAQDLMVEQARIIENIDKKLDELLKK